MDITRKCPLCGKYYFYLEGKPCPHCKNKPKDELQIFKDLFGDDNPFSNME